MRNLIRKSPPWIKKPIKYIYRLIPYERRLGKVFWDTYNFLQESQWWSKEQLEEYQMRQLEKLLKHTYENVPYYQRVFDERGLKYIKILITLKNRKNRSLRDEGIFIRRYSNA